MGTKHTPGPWHTGGYSSRIIYAGDGFAVADATVFHGRHEGEHEANARLIAAAPELLDVLQEVTRCLAWHEEQHGVGMDRKAVESARAAIAKATGSAS